MTTEAEEAVPAPKPKRKYKPRIQCTDPHLKYRYKKKPGPKTPRQKRRMGRKFATRKDELEYRRKANAHRISLDENPERFERNAEHLREQTAKRNLDRVKYTRIGVPNGMRRAEAKVKWAEAREKAEEIYNKMVEQGIAPPVDPADFEQVIITAKDGTEYPVLVPKTDDAKAATALKEAMTMALSPMSDQDLKHKAIRTVLEWTKAKPASKQEVSLSKAEDWLAMVTADADKHDGQEED